MQRILLSEAISQLRDDLRYAVLEGADQDIVFTPKEIALELAISFETEAKASGGIKLLAFLDLSGEASATRTQDHKLTLTLDVADHNGNPIKVRSGQVPKGI